jgi:amino acid permease
MGGGIVSIPYAFTTAGFLNGVIVQTMVVISLYVSTSFYLAARRKLKCDSSFSAIAQLCLGDYSGVLINFLITFAIFGILSLYMILFSRIAISIFGGSSAQALNDVDASYNQSILDSKYFYIVLLGLFQLPIVLRKRLQELKFTSYILFGGVIALLWLLAIKLKSEGSYYTRLDATGPSPVLASVNDLNESESQLKFEKVIDSCNIAMASYGFILGLFPVRNDMQSSAKPKLMVSVTMALIFTMSTYVILSVMAASYFGTANVQPSIFDNLVDEHDWMSVTLRLIFLTIFMCNIPFIFFAGKLSIFAIINLVGEIREKRHKQMLEGDLLGNQNGELSQIIETEEENFKVFGEDESPIIKR